MSTWIIIIVIAVLAVICDLYRHYKYTSPSLYDNLKKKTVRENGIEGNAVEVFTDMNDMLPRMVEDIDQAKESVHVQFFRFDSDELGELVADHLISSRKRGVEVRLLYDGLTGMWKSPGFIRRLKRAGVEVHGFNGLYPFPSLFLNNRNHRKIVVIDSKIGYIGGMNINKKYARGIRGGVWRDTHLRIGGGACSQLQRSFLSDWSREADGMELENMRRADYYIRETFRCGDTCVQIITSQPDDEPWLCQSICHILEEAHSYVYLQSPYFVPRKELINAMCAARRSGVDVRLMVPFRGDCSVLMTYASRRHYRRLMDAGVRIYEFTKGFLHAKTVVSDGYIVSIGSCNLDHRSFTQSFEANALIYDESVSEQMRQIFEEDIKSCHELEAEWWNQRSSVERMMELISLPLTYLL